MESDVFSLFIAGLLNAMTPSNLLVMIIGLAVGIIGGMLPGIAVVTAIALFIPFTFTMSPETALIALGAVYSGATYGGANASILINTPGQPSSVMTALDGYQLTLQGKAEEALYAALIASAWGGIIGTVVLLVFFRPLASVALKFGSESFFWMAIFGLTTLAAMFPGKVCKTMLAGAIGLGLSTIGLDPSGGIPRFTFGSFNLLQGFDMIVLMVALFSISQMLAVTEENADYIAKYDRVPGAFRRAWSAFVHSKLVVTVTGVAGTFIGTLPGAGGTVASIIAYNEAKRWDKNPDRFGKGCLDGVMIPECANNACVGGALVPLMALGIPGSSSAAVMVGGLLAQGLTPGPAMFLNNSGIAYTFISSLFIANVFMIAVGYIIARVCTKILDVPKSIIVPSVITLSCIGAYSLRGTMFDVLALLIAGGLAYIFLKIDLPPVGVALGVVLGPIIEENLLVTISRAQASSLAELFLFSPLSMLFIILSALSLALPLYLEHRMKRRRPMPTRSARAIRPANLIRFDSLCYLTILVICCCFIIAAGDLEKEDSAIFPYFVFGAGVFFSALILFQQLLEPAREGLTPQKRHACFVIAAYFGIAMLAYILVEYLGFFSAMFLCMFCMLAYDQFVEKAHSVSLARFARLALVSLAVIGAQYLAFTRLIGVETPVGLFV